MKIRWLMSLYPKANLCGCFCWALPRSLLLRCFLVCGETQIWPGDLRVALVFGVFRLCFFVWCNVDLPFSRTKCVPVQQLFTAYAIVRTEPSATSAKPEEKKWAHSPRRMKVNRSVAQFSAQTLNCNFFCRRRPLPFGGPHLRLPSGPAGIRTTTGRRQSWQDQRHTNWAIGSPEKKPLNCKLWCTAVSGCR